jgi:hypothetical protein
MSSAAKNTKHSAGMIRVDSWNTNCSCFGCFLSPFDCYCTAVLGIHRLINFKFLIFSIDSKNVATAKQEQQAFFSLVLKTKACQYW